MGIYYLYINRENLNNFLLENLIFPYDKSFFNKRAMSLMLDNVLILFTKKYTKEIIEKNCDNGFIPSVVLEIELPNKIANITYKDEDLLIINDLISFSNVKKIYNVSERTPNFTFNDIYLFESLIDENLFNGNYSSFNSEFIDKLSLEKVKNLNYKKKCFSKLQGFYCARFGYLKEEIKEKKKKVIFSMNCSSNVFKYISNLSFEEFYKSYFETDKLFENNKITCIDKEFEYLNNNFENILLGILTNNNLNLDDNYYSAIYKTLFEFNSGDILEILKEKPIFKNALDNVVSLKWNQINNISFLKEYFAKIDDNKLSITIFILSKIVEMDIDDAKLYINNFFENCEYETELLSMYGLAKGMKAISIVVKKKPDILLFAFNKSKKYFNSYIDLPEFSSAYKSYFEARNYIAKCIMNDGFDLDIFDIVAEKNFINNKYRVRFIKENGLDDKEAKKEILNIKKPERIHELFLEEKRKIKENN